MKLKILLLSALLTASAFADPLGGRDGCFLLVRLADGKVVEECNPRRVDERLAACSTFKIAAAAMAYDQKILDNRRVFIWDGQKNTREACNHNQTARSWIVDSVVWVTQQLTREMGMTKVKGYLARFRYGNQDMSGGIADAWWHRSTLKLSAREQVAFLSRLWKSQLPISTSAQAQTRELILVEKRGQDRMDGKTGTGELGGNRQLGWFVGHLRHAGQDYIFALNYSDRKEGETQGYAGPNARQLVKTELERLKLFPSSTRTSRP